MKGKLAIISGLETRLFSFNNIVVGVATGIGPRILYLSQTKDPESNLFEVFPQAGVKTEEGFWRLYGGHRLWTSPEASPRTYSRDDKPVKIGFEKGRLLVTGSPEEKNLVQKEIEITSHPCGGILVSHRIRNIGRWPIRFACWALSVMQKEGVALIPLQPFAEKGRLLPDRHITLWPYTNLTDERLTFGNVYIAVKQSPQVKKPIKIGTFALPAWTAYQVATKVFVKSFFPSKGDYPDFGCSVEVYTNSEFLELETVGPLTTVEPGDYAEHQEVWEILETKKTDTDSLFRLVQSQRKFMPL